MQNRTNSRPPTPYEQPPVPSGFPPPSMGMFPSLVADADGQLGSPTK